MSVVSIAEILAWTSLKDDQGEGLDMLRLFRKVWALRFEIA